jgi:hypothetical protein
MALNFPANPVNGQVYNSGYASYTFNSTSNSWIISAASLAPGIVGGSLGVSGSLTVGTHSIARVSTSTFVLSDGDFVVDGDCQSAQYVLRASQNTSTSWVLSLDGTVPGSTTNQIVLAAGAFITFSAMVTFKDIVTGDAKMWRIDGSIKRPSNAASTNLLTAPSVTLLAADTAASSWTLNTLADTTNGALQFVGQASSGNTIRAGAIVTTMEII